jgi:hypothetical protein
MKYMLKTLLIEVITSPAPRSAHRTEMFARTCDSSETSHLPPNPEHTTADTRRACCSEPSSYIDDDGQSPIGSLSSLVFKNYALQCYIFEAPHL